MNDYKISGSQAKKILVADDSTTIHRVIRLALQTENYEIQAVSNGNDALAQVSLFRPDLILVDIALPGKSAFEFKKQLNASPDERGLKVILLSSAYEPVDEDRVKELGFDGRLIKPFDPTKLKQVLQQTLSQGSNSQVKNHLEDEPRFQLSKGESRHLRFLDSAPQDEISMLTEETLRLSEASSAPRPMQQPPVSKPTLSLKTTKLETIDDDLDWKVDESAIQSENLEKKSTPALDPLPPFSDAFGDHPTESSEFSKENLNRQIELLVQLEVEARMRDWLQKNLPDLAERWVKEELKRMLEDRP